MSHDDQPESPEPARPAWVPQSEPAPDETQEPEDPQDGTDQAAPEDSIDPDQGADVASPPQAPVDDSATRSFPPLGPVGPPPGSPAGGPPAPEDGPQWAAPPSSAPPGPGPSGGPPPAVQPPGSAPAAPPNQQPAAPANPASPPAPAPQAPPTPAPQPPPSQAQPPAQGQPPQAQPPQPRPPQGPGQQNQPPQAQAPHNQAPQNRAPQAQPPQQGQPSQGFPPQGQSPQAPYGAPPQGPGPGAPPPGGFQAQGQQAPVPGQYGAVPNQQQYQGQAPGPGPAYAAPGGPISNVGAPAPAPKKRSKLGPVLGLAAVVGLVGGGLAFVATRDSGESVDAVAASSTTTPGSETTLGSGTTDDQTTTVPAPLGAEELSRSVVQIQLLLEGQPTCTGSGTIVDEEGTIVTNFHVVEQSPICPHDRIGIAVSETSQAIPTLTYEADLLAFDSDLDLAVIRIARDLDGVAVTESFTPIAVGDSDAVALGDEIRVIGYPGIGGETVTFTTGSVSGFAETAEGGERSWLKTDATITGGNSGGLAADTAGAFVGIPTRVGTGSGQIVDCRVIADSNGDGQLNNADSCVPIGGFINGIRPVALVLPLLAEAETAAPIDQGAPEREAPMSSVLPDASNPIWTSAVDDSGRATDEFIAASVGLPELCLTWDYENVPTGILSDAVWLIDGEGIPEASVIDTPNDGPSSGSFFACINRSGGLLAGTYELAWLVDGELVFTEGIIVNDGATVIVEVLNSTELPLCVVQFNPFGTNTYGLNELAEPLAPGESVVLEVGLGQLDARVIDCDGDVRIEDNSGFEIQNDILVTVE